MTIKVDGKVKASVFIPQRSCHVPRNSGATF